MIEKHGSRPAPQRRVPLLLAGAVAILLGVRFATPKSEDRIDWIEFVSNTAAVERSLATKKPILYYFSAAWCGPCKTVKDEVFAREEHARFIRENFVAVRVTDVSVEKGVNPLDLDALQKQFSVGGFPSFVVARVDEEVAAPGVKPKVVQVASERGFRGPTALREHLSFALATIQRLGSVGNRPD